MISHRPFLSAGQNLFCDKPLPTGSAGDIPQVPTSSYLLPVPVHS